MSLHFVDHMVSQHVLKIAQDGLYGKNIPQALKQWRYFIAKISKENESKHGLTISIESGRPWSQVVLVGENYYHTNNVGHSTIQKF